MGLKKRHSPQQKQENISRKQFETFLEKYDFVTGDISPDLGEDILVRIYDRGVSTGLSFYVQLKSVGNIKKYRLKSGDISYSFEVKDLEHWRVQAVTVFLVIWDVKLNCGWWVWINDAIRLLQIDNQGWEKKEKVKIHISSKNQINENGLSKIRYLLADLYYPIVSREGNLTINTKFSFPKTPEGMAKFEELKQHFAKGDEVELDGKYIELFDLPELWKRLYGNFEPSDMQLKIMPARSKTPQPTKIEFISDIETELFPYVTLWTVKQGEEEATLMNDEQKNIPFKFTIVLNRVLQKSQINIEPNLINLDGPGVLQILRTQKILSDGGRIEVTFLATGDVIKIPFLPNSFPAPNQNEMTFIERICHIQKVFGTRLILPENGGYSEKDFQAADELVSIIDNGTYQQSEMTFTIELKKPGIAKIIKELTDGAPIYFQITAKESFIKIFSQKIDLGPMLQKIRGYWKKPLEEIKFWLNKAEDEDVLEVELVDVEVYEEFENWLKK